MPSWFSQTGAGSAPWYFHAPDASPRVTAREITQPRMRLIANAGEVGIDAALRGHGLARAMSYQVDAAVRAGTLRIVLAAFEPPPIPVHVVSVAGRKAPAKVRAFVDFAVERLRREPVLMNDWKDQPSTAITSGGACTSSINTPSPPTGNSALLFG